MITQRFNQNPEWRVPNAPFNTAYHGLNDMIKNVAITLDAHFPNEHKSMLEIGSYMGESTMMFAASHAFETIITIDPLEGKEKFNDIFGYDWETVRKEFNNNTRMFNNIRHIRDYSYNVVDSIPDNSLHYIYIDGDHEYKSVKYDIEMFLPKLKSGGIISGHDYFAEAFPGVVRAVNDLIGRPDQEFSDTSWIKIINK